jgi:hypothetical protein
MAGATEAAEDPAGEPLGVTGVVELEQAARPAAIAATKAVMNFLDEGTR